MIEAYWQRFLAEGTNRKTFSGRSRSAWHFCDNWKDADELVELVRAGTKRGTAGLEASYEAEKEDLPEPGDLSIILNWAGEPRCIIEALRVWSWPFDEVPQWFAEIEGEGDGSLDYWRWVHKEAFVREARELGIEFSGNSIVVCEEFTVVYR